HSSALYNAACVRRLPRSSGHRHSSKELHVSCGHDPLLASPLPALSPQGGERVAAGRERGWFMGSFHDLTIAHLNHELARTILCCTCNKQLSRWRRGSWKGERFLSRNAHG